MTGDLHAHAAPQPHEAPEPAPERHRDLVREKALIVGLEAMNQRGLGPHSVADFAAGVAAYEEYRRRNDRRAW
jgi:hypothetical protein